jgi:hypothetical protein
MRNPLTAVQRQRWRFERLVAVAQSAYLDEQGEIATWALQVAWLAAEDQSQFGDVIASAQFILDHPIDGIDRAILQDLINYPVRMEITLSA